MAFSPFYCKGICWLPPTKVHAAVPEEISSPRWVVFPSPLGFGENLCISSANTFWGSTKGETYRSDEQRNKKKAHGENRNEKD